MLKLPRFVAMKVSRQRLKQLLEQRSQLQKEYDDMVQENKYNAEIQGYEDAKELAQQNADEEIALIQSSLEKQNAVIEESLQLAQENYDEVFTYLGSIADVYGLSLQTNIVDLGKMRKVLLMPILRQHRKRRHKLVHLQTKSTFLHQSQQLLPHRRKAV